jgi:hypothetical protein
MPMRVIGVANMFKQHFEDKTENEFLAQWKTSTATK